MVFQQTPLPYDLGALSPFLSEEQMDYHYNKHHAGYVKKLNALVEGKIEATLSLEDLIKKTPGALFNSAAQSWNHSFFWNCMSSSGMKNPKGDLLRAIEKGFGSIEDFITVFSKEAKTLFGSGWTWLVMDEEGKLEIMSLGNAGNPLSYRKRPLLTLDVWEHAYYIDYRNERSRYIKEFWKVVDWDFVYKNYRIQ